MATDDRLSVAIQEIRDRLAERDALVIRMRTTSVDIAEFNAAQDRLADCVEPLLAALVTVLAKHHPEDSEPCCAECGFTWECPTVRDITAALTGEARHA